MEFQKFLNQYNGNRSNEGLFIKPIVMTDTDHTMKIMQEEIFGPVIAISRVKN